jgi:plastocyanin domain-containing protein
MTEIKIKKTTLYLSGIIILILIGGFFLLNKESNSEIRDTIKENNGEVQKVVISIKDYNYYPNTIKVKAGNPVSITLDESVQGCFRSFTIKALGINQYLKTPQDTLVFTPTKTGKYTFACSMGMGTGTLIVE